MLEREVEAGATRTGSSLAMKIAVLYRDELQKADRAMRAFEKVLQLDENNLERGRGADPALRGRPGSAQARRVLEIQLGHTRDGERARQERMQRLARVSTRSSCATRARRSAGGSRRFAEDHERRRRSASEIERLAAETGGWNELVDAYAASLREVRPQGDALPLMLVMARVHRERSRATSIARST